ncbi:MAG: glycosyltransferase family 9 protein [Candidatus Omnitrophica bacterium]|nr:glycosyltransferase family 9 protein [Candidatus Omnitrophota bacterium]MDE2231247.1 glycosyltransferase family 9 protein [Candidatus Omnitrophota bacterium]
MKITKLFHNVLIVRTDRIGDVVLTTPAIKSLRHTYPTARLSILVSPSTRDLVDGNPYLDEVLVDERQGRHQGLLGFLRLALQLRSRHFDLAVIFHTKRRYNLACCLAGIPCRLGYKNDKYGFLLTHPLKDTRHLGEKHEAQYCKDVLRPLGIEDDEMGVFVPLQPEAEAWALGTMRENSLVSNEFIVVHPGASDPAKRWPAADFARVMESLIQRHPFKIVLIGAPQTAPVAAEILRLVPQASQCLNLTGHTTVAQMASLLRRSRLLISNDSGPVHVAAGVGTSVISIFMRDDPGINVKRWKPLGARSHVLNNKFHPGAVKAEDVLKLVEQIFRKNSQYEIF